MWHARLYSQVHVHAHTYRRTHLPLRGYICERKKDNCVSVCIWVCVFLVVSVMSSGLRSDRVYGFVHTSGCLYMYASLVMPQLSSAI